MRETLDPNDEPAAVDYTVGAAMGMVVMLYLAAIEEPDEAQVAARRCVTDYLAAHIADERTRRLLEARRRHRLALPRRPRARQSHRRRTAARRAEGIRSGNDPGDEPGPHDGGAS
jgi:hypothetical protein